MQNKFSTFIFLIIIGLVSFLSSCKKDKNNLNDSVVISSVFGRVVDESGIGVYAATVQAGDKSATTDANGIFKITNVSLSKNHAFVRVSKTGYFDGSRTFVALSGKINNVAIRLLTKSLKGTFSASTGATINVTSAASVEFPANSIKNTDGSIYTGTVKVFAAFLDPTDANLETKMPGDLIGLRTDNSENLLRSFGMMNVELEDASGNKLNIADGKEVTLSMTVPASLLSAATATIPLWFFDTNDGLWKEEGSATLTGNKYIGKVKHFSWWNCDTPAASVNLTFRVTDADGNPIPNVITYLKNTDNRDQRSGTTNNDGIVSGLVYSNTVLELSYFDACGNISYIQNIGPLTTNTDIGDVIVNTTIHQGTYSGKIINCAGNVISNAYIKYTLLQKEYFICAENNGSFNFSVNVCNIPQNITMTAYDIDDLKIGLTQDITFNTGKTDLGNIAACNSSIAEYIQLSFDGGPTKTFLGISVEIDTNGQKYFIGYSDTSLSYSSYIRIKTTSPIVGIGTYEVKDFSCYLYNPNFTRYFSKTPSGLNTIITSYPTNSTEYYEGSINGVFIDKTTLLSHAVSCVYRIKSIP